MAVLGQSRTISKNGFIPGPLKPRFRGFYLAKSAHNLSQGRPTTPLTDLAQKIPHSQTPKFRSPGPSSCRKPVTKLSLQSTILTPRTWPNCPGTHLPLQYYVLVSPSFFHLLPSYRHLLPGSPSFTSLLPYFISFTRFLCILFFSILCSLPLLPSFRYPLPSPPSFSPFLHLLPSFFYFFPSVRPSIFRFPPFT